MYRVLIPAALVAGLAAGVCTAAMLPAEQASPTVSEPTTAPVAEAVQPTVAPLPMVPPVEAEAPTPTPSADPVPPVVEPEGVPDARPVPSGVYPTYTLPPCEQEDSPNCYWDAAHMGNGGGQSFIWLDGKLYREVPE